MGKGMVYRVFAIGISLLAWIEFFLLFRGAAHGTISVDSYVFIGMVVLLSPPGILALNRFFEWLDED